MAEIDSALVASAIVVALAIVSYWLVIRIGRRFVRRMESRDIRSGARAATLLLVFRQAMVTVFTVTAVMVLFDIWQLSLTPFLAVGTVIGAAIGFGAQDFVRDVIAGFFILSEDQYHVGDNISIADTTGKVEDIRLRITVLRDEEGILHYVPNGDISVASNLTRQVPSS